MNLNNLNLNDFLYCRYNVPVNGDTFVNLRIDIVDDVWRSLTSLHDDDTKEFFNPEKTT
jgi:hypothetical protein